MFGFDFSQIAEAIPKMQEIGEKLKSDFAALVTEQKAQRELINQIAEKLGIDQE